MRTFGLLAPSIVGVLKLGLTKMASAISAHGRMCELNQDARSSAHHEDKLRSAYAIQNLLRTF